jgi:hypothetical protein
VAHTDLDDAIAKAISGSRYKWRTATGISKEISVDERQVFHALQNSDRFIKARRTNDRGEALYTTAERYRKETSLMNRLLSAAANTVYDD